MSNDPDTEFCVIAFSRLQEKGLLASGQRYLVVDIASQRLVVCKEGSVLSVYPVSTSARGPGCEEDSFKTPTGIHRIAEKIGESEPEGMVFEGRVPTGEKAEIQCRPEPTSRDIISSRILWLEGMEPGINQGSGVDSRERYIYIHGTNEEGLIGQAVSHGCVRLLNKDIIELFDQVDTGMLVLIQ